MAVAREWRGGRRDSLKRREAAAAKGKPIKIPEGAFGRMAWMVDGWRTEDRLERREALVRLARKEPEK